MIFGRSCEVCTFNFITSEPNVYTCPFCQKVADLVSRGEIYDSAGPAAPRRRVLSRVQG